MGGAVSAGEDNEELVDNLVEADYVKTTVVEKALRAVDRGNYYLDEYRDNAYKDLAWKHGNLHLSAPCIYSEVLECLRLGPGMSFLNLGSGTGYLSTVAGLLLGSYGVNHGVELHSDVVEYGRKKFEEFISESPAVDLMDFCPPKFVSGNCLQLDPATSNQTYDRVYCGAAVPEEHIGFVKSLIKIGGIVVMPCEDQLLQIKRTGENSWDQKRVLPVSFASLIVPTKEQFNTNGTVYLPSREPLTLLEICRSVARTVLRKRISEDNPEYEMRSLLLLKNKTAPRSASEGNEMVCRSSGSANRRRQRRLRRIVIPVFQQESEEEDETPPLPEQRVRDPEHMQRLRRHVIAFGAADVYRNRGGRIHMEGLRWNRFYVGGGRRRVVGDQSEQDAIEPDAQASSNNFEEVDDETLKSTIAKDQDNLSDEEEFTPEVDVSLNSSKDDVKSGDETNSTLAGQVALAAKTLSEEIANQIPYRTDNETKYSDAVTSKANNDDNQLLPLEENDEQSQRSADAIVAAADGSKRSRSESEVNDGETRRKRAASFPWRNGGGVGGPLPVDDGSECDDDNEAYKDEQRQLRSKNSRMQQEFSRQMKEKILFLPLPEALKNYLNYYRN